MPVKKGSAEWEKIAICHMLSPTSHPEKIGRVDEHRSHVSTQTLKYCYKIGHQARAPPTKKTYTGNRHKNTRQRLLNYAVDSFR
mmetsp:Transcript_39877/g.58678  ORF Transcript_39877/g.58678 Transcript_39877/m.58678 type:complete len:84 (+) Transcript_39877:367-618(+)